MTATIPASSTGPQIPHIVQTPGNALQPSSLPGAAAVSAPMASTAAPKAFNTPNASNAVASISRKLGSLIASHADHSGTQAQLRVNVREQPSASSTSNDLLTPITSNTSSVNLTIASRPSTGSSIMSRSERQTAPVSPAATVAPSSVLGPSNPLASVGANMGNSAGSHTGDAPSRPARQRGLSQSPSVPPSNGTAKVADLDRDRDRADSDTSSSQSQAHVLPSKMVKSRSGHASTDFRPRMRSVSVGKDDPSHVPHQPPALQPMLEVDSETSRRSHALASSSTSSPGPATPNIPSSPAQVRRVSDSVGVGGLGAGARRSSNAASLNASLPVSMLQEMRREGIRNSESHHSELSASAVRSRRASISPQIGSTLPSQSDVLRQLNGPLAPSKLQPASITPAELLL
ncbi:hypothetical protein BC831DRAFT_276990 [Entophlyctis helioformis]|nr:hypothetical protein BC831DRAFT_276990 [Entophlyctis helioformis]